MDRLDEKALETAVHYLTLKGYEVLERNWECPAGEVDVIAVDERDLVFVDVSARTNIEEGFPGVSSTAEERAERERQACWYLREVAEGAVGLATMPVRFDNIAITVTSPGRVLLRHHVNALGPSA